ncbi:MAG: glycosyltransferase family 2 protein [Methyloligella sp. ZOD6]
MKVSIVIRAYNEDEHLEKLLLGISVQTLQPHEIILVDSGSTDQTVDIARRYGVKIVPIEKAEFTFGRALNYGCKAATGDICVFASAHVYPVYDTWLETLVAPFRDDRVAVSYGRQIGNELNKFSEHQIFAQWFPEESMCPQGTYFCNNANCAIRHADWEKHPYDESLTGLEDLAWAKAAQARGGWISYVADAVIVHVHDESWDQVFTRYRREAIAMRGIDEHAKFTRLDLAWLLVRNIASDWMEAWRQHVLRKEIGSIVLFRYKQLTGTYRGHNDPPEISAALRTRFYYPKSPHERRLAQREKTRHAIPYEDLPRKPQAAGNEAEGQGTEGQSAAVSTAAGRSGVPNLRVLNKG